MKVNVVFLGVLMFFTLHFANASTTDNKMLSFDQENPEELVGKWMMDGDDETYIELNSDGTATEKSIGEPMKRFWSVKNDKLCLKASEKQNGAEMCIEFMLNQDVLVLTMDNMKLPYTRYRGH